MLLGARLAQTAGVLEGPLHVSISGVGVLAGMGHLEVRSFGFGILCCLRLNIDMHGHKHKDRL
jgi:hypothetical protein